MNQKLCHKKNEERATIGPTSFFTFLFASCLPLRLTKLGITGRRNDTSKTENTHHRPQYRVKNSASSILSRSSIAL
jgi:hypothetical protein